MGNDKYLHFGDLSENEEAGIDYNVCIRRADAIAVIAPHGGGIEPGTSEIAEAVAGGDHSLYLFEGIKSVGNGDLHITSSHFDEPSCIALLASCEIVVAVHGEARQEPVVFTGGLDEQRAATIQATLRAAGFTTTAADKPHLDGKAAINICNRGRSGAGVQLEISRGLRCRFFRSLSPRSQRQHTTPAFRSFVEAVREALA